MAEAVEQRQIPIPSVRLLIRESRRWSSQRAVLSDSPPRPSWDVSEPAESGRRAARALIAAPRVHDAAGRPRRNRGMTGRRQIPGAAPPSPPPPPAGSTSLRVARAATGASGSRLRAAVHLATRVRPVPVCRLADRAVVLERDIERAAELTSQASAK